MGFLPPKDREYLRDNKIQFEECEEKGEKAIIFKSYPLPNGKFDANEVDILVKLPSGYPNAKPDMFHLLPWVKLSSNDCYPRKADSSVKFNDEDWQRWSRHDFENPWRPGLDGIWTMLNLIKHALEEAE